MKLTKLAFALGSCLLAMTAPAQAVEAPLLADIQTRVAAVARVVAVIERRVVLTAHNALDHEDTTVGPYGEAVDRGIRFACIGVRGRCPEQRTRTAREAAEVFVDRVGTGRANTAARAAAKSRGLALPC